MKHRDHRDTAATLQWAAALGFFHLAGTALVAVVAALLLAGPARLQALVGAYEHGLRPQWSGLASHLALSGGTWGLLVGGYHYLRGRLRQRGRNRDRVVHSTDGVVMVETLIVLPFLLLVTSGIAQLTMINVTSVLADLAAWDAARTAWIWDAEHQLGRENVTSDDVEFRAMTAAAMTLAPTAGTDYTVGRNHPGGSGPDFRRARTAIVASFRPKSQHTGRQEWIVSGRNWDYFNKFGGTGPNNLRDADHRKLSFDQALDSMDFVYRAGRKCTQAFMNLEQEFRVVRRNDKIGVHFTYRYSLLFPWYAYIFGQVGKRGLRTAHYMPIEREFMFPKQTQF